MASIDNAAISAIKLDELGAAPTTPATGDWKIYAKSTGLFVIDDAGVETGPLAAASGGGNEVTFVNEVSPANPAAGSTILYAHDIGTLGMPLWMQDFGGSYFTPPYGNWRNFRVNGTGAAAVGDYTPSAVGNWSYMSGDTTTDVGRMPYYRAQTTASANNVSGQAFISTHDALFGQLASYTHVGGYLHRVRFCYDFTTNTTPKLFVGVNAGASQASFGAGVEPSALTNCIGVGCDSGDTNLQFFHNDASGTATKIDLGVTRASLNLKVLEFFVFVANNGNAKVALLALNTGTAYGSDITTNLPAVGTAVYPKQTIANGADAIGMYMRLYVIDTIVKDYAL